jgi:phospholipid N-methyltransferase
MSRSAVFKNLLKDIRVASVLPTSSFGVKKLCRRVDPDRARVVVEYGPGTGPFTEHLLEKMPPDSKLVLIETNLEFYKTLKRIEDQRVHVFNDSAENVRNLLRDCGEERADYVISGIPFTLIKEPAKSRIIEDTRAILGENGRFLLYQHSGHMKKYLARHFRNVDTGRVILNIPPLFIFEAYD